MREKKRQDERQDERREERYDVFCMSGCLVLTFPVFLFQEYQTSE